LTPKTALIVLAVPVRVNVKEFSSGSPLRYEIPNQHSRNCAICGPLLRHLSLPQLAVDGIRCRPDHHCLSRRYRKRRDIGRRPSGGGFFWAWFQQTVRRLVLTHTLNN